MSPSGDDLRPASPEDGDELVRRYRQASAGQTPRPSPNVKDAVRSHALAVIAAQTAPPSAVAAPAANTSRWKLSLLASLAVAAFAGLIVLQLDRGAADEKDLALGQPQRRNEPALPAPRDAVSDQASPPSVDNAGPSTAIKPPATPARSSSPAAQKSVARPVPSAGASLALPPPPAAPTPPPPAYPAELDQTMAASDPAAETEAPSPPAPLPSPAPQAAAEPLESPGVRVAPVAPSALGRSATPAEQRRANEAARPPGRRSLTSTLPLASALQEAARNGHASRLDRLLVRGAPLNAADTAGRTPLMLAVIHNHPAMVQRLLAAGANVSLIDRDGITALQHAQRLKRERIVRLIEEAS